MSWSEGRSDPRIPLRSPGRVQIARMRRRGVTVLVAIQPTVFVGSSSEGVGIADHLQPALHAKVPCEVTLWTQGVFEASLYTMASLIGAARKYDLVATPDDTVASRDDTVFTPRDNVIFELGLFVGALGLDRVYLVTDETDGLKIPSDMNGVTRVRYRRRQDGNMAAAVGPVALAIAPRIKALGARNLTVGTESLGPQSQPAQGDHARSLAREIDRICSSARAQGWRIKTNTDTTLRLNSPRGKRFTFTMGEVSATRGRLRDFAAELRAGGLRVNHSVRRPVEDAPTLTD
jgi:predicted nucleotide-binding protein